MNVNSRAEAWAVVAACLAALALRLFHLGTQSLWVDEYLTWHTAAAGGSLPWREVLQNDHGPLVQMLLHAWTGWAGDSEVALRLPSALATTALVPAFAALARRVLGSWAWVPGAWMAALSPFLVWYGQEARNYAFAILFATLAVWAAVRWQESGRARFGALVVLFGWLGLLSNLNVGLILPVPLAYIAFPHGGRRGRPWAALAAGLAILALESPWAVHYAHRLAWDRLAPLQPIQPAGTTVREGTIFSWGAYPFTFSAFSVGYTLGPTLRELHVESPWRAALRYWPLLVPAAAVFAVLAWSGLRALWGDRARFLLCVGLVLLPLLLVTYFSLRNFKIFNPRYVSSGIPGYYLILLAGARNLTPGKRRLAVASVLVLWAVSLSQHYFNLAYGKEDYRSAKAWLERTIRPRDELIAAGSPALLDYYWRNSLPAYEPYWLGAANDDSLMRAHFAELRDSTKQGYVLVSRPYALDPRGRFERFLLEEQKAVPVFFHGVTVYRIDPRPIAPSTAPVERARPVRRARPGA